LPPHHSPLPSFAAIEQAPTDGFDTAQVGWSRTAELRDRQPPGRPDKLDNVSIDPVSVPTVLGETA
jgi:hypothetical protein